jgi:serine/threonine protein kinase
VYVDDEPIGTTDPEWGRLVRSGLAPGSHRVRLSAPGHADVTATIDVPASGRTELRRRLDPAGGTPRSGARVLLVAGIAVSLMALIAWALRGPSTPDVRTPATPRVATPALDSAVTPARPTPGRALPSTPTPAERYNPGAHPGPEGGEYFGEYRLVRLLGRGGMASVYEAERAGERIALKRPLAGLLGESEFLERFLRESEIGRALHHPNIIRILQRGSVEGIPYFTMELVAGETLHARLSREGALDPRAAVDVVAQIGEALDYAHSKGVVHRDLKPSNVMLRTDGTVKVMDFGIARARHFEGLTVTGAFLGSPEYVAPEAIEGRPTDARSDLYSLGVILYETLAGRRPFVGEAAFAVLRQHLTDTPPPPSVVRPGVPLELDRLVMRLMSKSPADRPAAADALLVELRGFLNGVV